MSTNPPPSKQTIETVLEQLSKEDLLSLIKQMVQQHPDLTELIATRQPTAPKKQRHIPFKPEVYRRQVAEIFPRLLHSMRLSSEAFLTTIIRSAGMLRRAI